MLVTADYVNRHQAYIKSAGILLVQLEIPMEAVFTTAKIAKDANVTVIFNPAPASALPETLMPLIDIITPNEIEALTGITVTDNSSAE